MISSLLRKLRPFGRQTKKVSPQKSIRRLTVEVLEARQMLSLWGDDLNSADESSNQVEIVQSETTAEVSTGDVNHRIVGATTTRIVNGDPTSDFASVGIVGDNSGGFCSGTLISPTHVLTAAHCAEGVGDTQGRFEVGGTTYSTSDVIVHPSWNGDTNDIAIYELNRAVEGITPSLIYRDTPYVGQVLTLVGFGGGGTGSGHNGDFGTKREGETPIDGVENLWITWTFDNNSESNTAPGDSGGPAFVEVGGVFYIAGVTSGGTRGDAGIGDFSFDTRVDVYAGWIDSIVGDYEPSPDPAPDPTPDPEPDPTPDPDPDPTPDPEPDPNPNPGNDDFVNHPGQDATQIVVQNGFGFVDGMLETAGDRDVFYFTVSTPSEVYIDLFSWNGDLDTYLQVMDQNGHVIAENDDSYGWTDSSLSLDLDAGTYFVSAAAYDDAGSGEYGVDVYVEEGGNPDPNPDPHPNPDPESGSDDHPDVPSNDAAMIVLNEGIGTVEGRLEIEGDRDVFQVTLETDGTLTASLYALDWDLDTVLYVYDESGVLIAENDDASGYGGTDSELVLDLSAGIYFISAGAYMDCGTGNYGLHVETESVDVPDPDPVPELETDDHVDENVTDDETATNDGVASLTESAYEVDQQFGLAFTGNYYENLIDQGEKWMKGTDAWFFIKPDGTVFQWTGSLADSEMVCSLDPTYHADPSKLHDAEAPSTSSGMNSAATETGHAAVGEVDELAQLSFEIDQKYGLEFTGNYYENLLSQGEKWLRGADGWYFIESNGDVYHWTGSLADSQLVCTLDESYHADPSKLHDAQAPTASNVDVVTEADSAAAVSAEVDALAQLAYDVNQQYNLETSGNFYENLISEGEKWLRGANGWYFINPDGELYRWTGSLANSQLVCTLDSSYHADPSKLYDAEAPATSSAHSSTATTVDDTSTDERDALAQLSSEVNQQYDLRFAGNYYEDLISEGEKWLQGNDAWYFIKPDGSVYRWTGSLASSELVCTLDASYHADPSMLYDAE